MIGTIQDGIQVVSASKLLEVVLGESWWKVSYKEETEAIKKWIADNDATYYAAPKEDFFIWKGIEKAKAEGKKIVVVENMS